MARTPTHLPHCHAVCGKVQRLLKLPAPTPPSQTLYTVMGRPLLQHIKLCPPRNYRTPPAQDVDPHPPPPTTPPKPYGLPWPVKSKHRCTTCIGWWAPASQACVLRCSQVGGHCARWQPCLCRRHNKSFKQPAWPSQDRHTHPHRLIGDKQNPLQPPSCSHPAAAHPVACHQPPVLPPNRAQHQPAHVQRSIHSNCQSGLKGARIWALQTPVCLSRHPAHYRHLRHTPSRHPPVLS